MELAVSIREVTKRYPRTAGYRELIRFWQPRRFVDALRGVTMEVPRGSTFGILGANGAGKTTLLKVLAGLVLVDEGEVMINGVDVTREPTKARDSLMYVSVEERSHYWRLTAQQNLRFFAMQYGLPKAIRDKRVDELISLVGLEAAAGEHVMKFSTGMRQRLSIARGLLPDPDILLLDEPTRSMDPVGARKLWGFIREELSVKQGKTVLIATHNMEEAAFLCDQVAIVNQGRVELCDHVTRLTNQLTGQGHFSISVAQTEVANIEQLRRLEGVSSVVLPRAWNGHIAFDITVDDSERSIPMVVDALVNSGGRVLTVEPKTTSLGELVATLAGERSS